MAPFNVAVKSPLSDVFFNMHNLLVAGHRAFDLHPKIDYCVLGCTLQVCKLCTFPASRLKREPRVSDRDMNGLLDRGSYKTEAKGPGATPHCDSRQDMAANFATCGRRRLPFIGGIDVRLPQQLPGKPAAEAGGKHISSH